MGLWLALAACRRSGDRQLDIRRGGATSDECARGRAWLGVVRRQSRGMAALETAVVETAALRAVAAVAEKAMRSTATRLGRLRRSC